MKIFEVRTEDSRKEEIEIIVEYVAANTIGQVMDEYLKEALACDCELKSVREVLTISRNMT